MNLGDLANLGQIIGALPVVISSFYVARQIRQNTPAKGRSGNEEDRQFLRRN